MAKPQSTIRNPRPAIGSTLTRRGFVKATAAATMAALGPNFAHAAGDEVIKVGLIGCGGRGSGAANDVLKASPATRIVALGDLFKERVDGTRGRLTAKDNPNAARVDLPDDRCFVGFDAYKRVIDCGVDLVLMATPPAFRPAHMKYAADAGKHMFVEKPVATDAPGVRTVLQVAKIADEKKLAIVAGTQRRHQSSYVQTIRRIHDGAIGDVIAGQVYWCQGGLWKRVREAGWSDMEWQIRNWLYFTWLSGDHIVEQHVHNLDVMCWVMNAHPVSAFGMGGRQVRTEPVYGNIFDHFAIEYEFANGARWLSMCRQIDGTDGRNGERAFGTKGKANPAGSLNTGGEVWRAPGGGMGAYQQEHADLVASILAGKPLNEARQVAESTLVGIMGRMSAYTGKQVTWEQAMNSQQSLVPEQLEFGPLPVAPVAMPGRDPLV